MAVQFEAVCGSKFMLFRDNVLLYFNMYVLKVFYEQINA